MFFRSRSYRFDLICTLKRPLHPKQAVKTFFKNLNPGLFLQNTYAQCT